MFDDLPIEILEIIFNQLDFISLIRLSMTKKNMLNIVSSTPIIKLKIHIDSKMKEIAYNTKYINYGLSILRSLKLFTKIRQLTIYDCNILNNEIIIFKLFSILKNFLDLRVIRILINYKVSQKNYILLNYLIQLPFLNQLTVLDIPYIIFDAPSIHKHEFMKFFCINFSSQLTKLQVFCLNFKDNSCLHHYFISSINCDNITKIKIIGDMFTFVDFYSNKTLIFKKLKTLNLVDSIQYGTIYKYLNILNTTTRNNIEKLKFDLSSVNLYISLTTSKMILLQNIFGIILSMKNLCNLTFMHSTNVYKYYSRGNNNSLIDHLNSLPQNTSITKFSLILPLNYKSRFKNKINIHYEDSLGLFLPFINKCSNITSFSFYLTRFKCYQRNYSNFKSIINNYITNNNGSLHTLVVYNIDLYRYLYQILRLAYYVKSIKKLYIIYTNDFYIKKKLLNNNNICIFNKLVYRLRKKLEVCNFIGCESRWIAKYRLEINKLNKYYKIINI